MLVVCTHMHWNPKLDFVKYGQAFWLLMKISEFLDDFELTLDKVPLVICGDFNADPTTSSIHMMMNKEYKITESSGRAHYRTGIKAYRTGGGNNIHSTEGFRIFQRVRQDYKNNLSKLQNVVGKLNSSTGFYNEMKQT